MITTAPKRVLEGLSGDNACQELSFSKGPLKDGSGLYTTPDLPLHPEPLPLPSRKGASRSLGGWWKALEAEVRRPGSRSSKPSSFVDKVTWPSRGGTGVGAPESQELSRGLLWAYQTAPEVTPCGSISSD